MTCIKLSPIGNGLAAGNASAVRNKISPTDVLAEEGPVFSFESFVPSHIFKLYHLK